MSPAPLSSRSSRRPLAHHFRNPLFSRTFQRTGTADQVVDPKAGARAAEQLTAAGVATELKHYAGMGHSSCPQELRDVAAFLAKCLPPQ